MTEPSVQLDLSADGPQTAGLVIQPFRTVAEDAFMWSVGPKRSVNGHFNGASERLALTYIAHKCTKP